MQVQDVLNGVSTDVRQVLPATGASGTMQITWVDRIHKDALHTSKYNYLIKQMATFNVVAGTSSYTIATTNTPARELLVYDRTFDRVLMPIENLGLPASKVEDAQAQPLQIPKPMLSASTSQQWPEYFYRIATSGNQIQLLLFPAPQKTAFDGTYEIYYEQAVTTLASLTDTLLIPDDGIDLVTAGVNMYATAFLKLDQEVQFWTQQYEMLKKGQANG